MYFAHMLLRFLDTGELVPALWFVTSLLIDGTPAKVHKGKERHVGV